MLIVVAAAMVARALKLAGGCGTLGNSAWLLFGCGVGIGLAGGKKKRRHRQEQKTDSRDSLETMQLITPASMLDAPTQQSHPFSVKPIEQQLTNILDAAA